MARVMVVEDESIVAMDLREMLRSFGHEVPATFATGEDAISGAARLGPDLILMDVHLKGAMDGIEAASQIRGQQDLPIIFLTAFADQETVQRATHTEPNGYLLKPYNEKELKVSVELALYKHRVDRQVRQRERWFSTTLRSIGDAVIACDGSLRVTFMNAVAEKLTGWPVAEAMGAPISTVMQLCAEKDRARVESPAIRALQESAVVGLDRNTLLISRSGEALPIEDSAAPIEGEEGEASGAVVVFRDVSEQRRLEARLALTERLASLGTLTAGIAHEINNPLTYNLSNQQFALKRVEQLSALLNEGQADPAALKSAFDSIREALVEGLDGAERVRCIVRDMKTFSQPQPQSRLLLLASAVAEDAIRLAWNEISCRARLVRDFRAAPLLLGDGRQLTQVLVNLLLNAAQSIPEGRAGEHQIRLGVDQAGDRVVIRVEDTGCGMSPEVMVRIFDPFFTTKAVGLGTGLGLAICHSIVNAHQGELTVTSRPGEGSAFTLLLPAGTPQPALPVERAGDRAPAPRRATRTRLLIIDDEPMVGKALFRALDPRHEVSHMTSGKAALALLRGGAKFDVVVSDLMMPEMTGMDVHEELRTLNPALADRMIFLTGGAFTQRSREFVASMAGRTLHKPLDLERLVELITAASSQA